MHNSVIIKCHQMVANSCRHKEKVSDVSSHRKYMKIVVCMRNMLLTLLAHPVMYLAGFIMFSCALRRNKIASAGDGVDGYAARMFPVEERLRLLTERGQYFRMKVQFFDPKAIQRRIYLYI